MKKHFLSVLVLALCAGSVLALDPMGVIESFDVATAGMSMRTIMLTCLCIMSLILGALIGMFFLGFTYRRVKWILTCSANNLDWRNYEKKYGKIR